MAQAANEYYKKKRETEKFLEPTPVKKIVDTEILAPKLLPEKEVVEFVPEQKFINKEQQVRRFGGVVGSDEYYSYKAENPKKLVNFMGGIPQINASMLLTEGMLAPIFRPVDDEIWDKMSRIDQTKMLGIGAGKMAANLITAAPVEIVKTIPRTVLTAWQLVKNITGGKPWYTAEDKTYIAEKTHLGEIPTWFKTKELAVERGQSPLASTFMAISEAAGDLAIVGSLSQAIGSALKPKMKLKPGQQILRPEEIEYGLKKAKINSMGEYAVLEKDVAKKYGGTRGDTYLKVTPAGKNSVEVAVVQRVKGIFGKGKIWVKNKIGQTQKVYQGGYGDEIKLESQIVPIKKVEPTIKKVPVPENIQKGVSEVLTEMELSVPGKRDWFAGDGGYVKGVPSTFPKWLPSEMRSTKLFESVTEKMGVKGSQFTKPEQRLVEELRREMARKADIPIEEITLNKIADAYVGFEEIRQTEKIISDTLIDLHKIPLKGQAKKLIAQKEIDNLNTIAKYKDIDDATLRAVSNVVTGKQIVGELTNAEYTSLAKVLGTMASSESLPIGAKLSFTGQKISPTGNYARYVEETTGVPLASEVYLPMEEAFRLAKNEVYSYGMRKNQIFGKYNGAKYGEERRLINAYIKGDKNVIVKNKELTPEIRNDLIAIADELVSLTREVGQFYNVNMEKFGDLYQPSVKEYANGRFQLYKQDMTLSKAAKGLTSFTRYQKRGSIEPLLDDASALFDIYIESLAKEKYVQPVVQRAADGIYKEMPGALKKWTDNYVGEKLGYASEFERKLNTFGTKINEKLGTNLDPETIRNLTDDGLLTVYSGALGLPRLDAPIRDMITTNMIGYGRMGPRFYGDAVKKAMSKKYLDYMREKGRLVEFGIPGGEDVARARVGVGRTRSFYRQSAEATLKPYGGMDNKMRAVWSAQAEMQFDDAIARFNAGKISWEQTKKELQFKEMGTPIVNMIEQKLVDKNIEGARDLFTNQIIDEISFPYRRGTGAPVTHGIGGSLAFNLSNWNIHFAHTMGRWIKTGQWGNFIRFWAAGAVTSRSLEETFGINADRFTTLKRIVNPTLSPIIQLGVNFYEGIMAIKNDNRKTFNANADALYDTFRALGHPGGVGIRNLEDFYKAYQSAGQPGIPEGMYRIYTKGEKTREFADFTDILFRGLGFQTEKEAETSAFLNAAANAKIDQARVKDKVEKLIIDGAISSDNLERRKKFEQATELIKEFKITGDFSDIYEDFNKPLIMQSYESMPKELKARFGNWYSELLKQEYNIK